MINDPYAPCSCGSGKKFKWCCQPIHAQLMQVFSLDEQGQHEASIKAMEELVAQHPTNPEVWGRRAQLLFHHDKVEEAEKALDRAFELFPTYPFGFLLKARFRLYEGEISGALTLLRKAAELYDPNTHDLLAQIQFDVFDCEMKLNRPIAAHAAAQLALRLSPGSENLRQGVRNVFSKENPNLPGSAWQLHAFKPLPANATAERRAAWDAALVSASTGKLTDALKAFENLTQGDVVEPAAWFNLGLSHAWLGNNAAALTALDQYVTHEPDETQAAQAWAMAEVLRYGQGMEDQADLVQHVSFFVIRDPNAFVAYLGELEKGGLVLGTQVDQEHGVLHTVILETPGPALTPELEAKQNLRPAAYVQLTGNLVHLSNVNRELLDKVIEGITQRLGDMIMNQGTVRAPAQFNATFSAALRTPRHAASKEEAEKRMRDGLEKHFEEVWLHRPLKSLGGVPPVDAAGHGVSRKKLLGVIQFLREVNVQGRFPYDIDRLAGKLGLATRTQDSAAGTRTLDINSLGASELAGLALDPLSTAQIDQAFQAALKLDARELAGRFASALVSRPPYPERPDRFAFYQLLINQALSAGNLDTALDYLNDGERDDCEHNEGRRRNEYELRRAQVHTRRGEFDQARDVFDRLIARVPTELSYRVSAAETMLSARQGSLALPYAKEGLAAALKANNRDLEGHFKELIAAAQR